MSNDDVTAQLQLFMNDPQTAASQHQVKQVLQDGSTPAIDSLFSSAEVTSGEYVTARDSYRKQFCAERQGQRICLDQILPGKAPFRMNDLVEDLVDVPAGQILRRLEDMERHSLLSARLDESPWSSSYWPVYQGGVGARYADPNCPRTSDWKQNQAYVQQHSAASIVASGSAAAINLLSPAEKYDLLVGDESFSLTSSAWDEGQALFKEFGKVETWQGICHGWSPASYMVPRPLYKVTLTAADGKTPLVFYPADIKALACLLWAKARSATRFIGGRCNEKKAPVDGHGRILSQDCFDTNPGTWHMSVVNQLGVARRPLVLDATYDYEVWNQPAYGYKYRYFNPQTGVPTDSLEEAAVARADFSGDKFSRYRAGNAKYFVGVVMDFYYVVETLQWHQDRNGPSDDALRKVTYLYDVELDDDRQIIGGEWYLTGHPDFLWTPPAGAKAQSVADYAAIGEWSGKGPFPDSWLKAAVAASRLGQPLAKLVGLLVDFAQ